MIATRSPTICDPALPVTVESGGISIDDETEVLVATEAGSYGSADLWVHVHETWLSRATLRLYAQVGSARVLIRQVPLADVPLTPSPADTFSGIAISLRGRPCHSFSVTCQASAGPPLSGGLFYLQLWRAPVAPSSAGGRPAPELRTAAPMVAAALVGRDETTGQLVPVSTDASGRLLMGNPLFTEADRQLLDGATPEATPDTLALRDGAGAAAFTAVRGAPAAGASSGGKLTIGGGAGGAAQLAGATEIDLGAVVGGASASADFVAAGVPVLRVKQSAASTTSVVAPSSGIQVSIVGYEDSSTASTGGRSFLTGQSTSLAGSTGGVAEVVGGKGQLRGGNAVLSGGAGYAGNASGGHVGIRGGGAVGSGSPGNVYLHGPPSSWEGGARIGFIGHVKSVPTQNPMDGVFWWAQKGQLVVREPSGVEDTHTYADANPGAQRKLHRKLMGRVTTEAGAVVTIVTIDDLPGGDWSAIVDADVHAYETVNDVVIVAKRRGLLRCTGGTLSVVHTAAMGTDFVEPEPGAVDVTISASSGDVLVQVEPNWEKKTHWTAWVDLKLVEH